MTVRHAVIMAGGAGSRLWPLTATTPKPLLEFCGAPFLVGMIEKLAHVDVEHVTVLSGRDRRPFEDTLLSSAPRGVAIEIVAEPEPLGTAGGIRRILDTLSGPIFVLNGDVLADFDYRALASRHATLDAALTIAVTAVEDPSTYGACVVQRGEVVEFREKVPTVAGSGDTLVNAGLYLLEPEALERFPQGPLSFEEEVFPHLLSSGRRLGASTHEGEWTDLGTPGRFREGHRLVLSGRLRWPGLRGVAESTGGVRIAVGSHVDDSAVLDGPVLILGGARIGPQASVGPNTVVGRGATIGQQATVRNSLVFEGASIGDGAHLDGVIVGKHARIGQDMALGEDSLVADNEHQVRRE